MNIRIIHSVRMRENTLYVDEYEVFQAGGTSEEWALLCYRHLGTDYPKFFKMDLMSKLGFLAAEYLFKEKDSTSFDPFERALILQNSESSLHSDKLYSETMYQLPSPSLFVYTLPNIVLGELSIRHGIKGENTFMLTEGFDSAQLSEYVGNLFKQQVAKQVVCGYLDCDAVRQDLLMLLLQEGAEKEQDFTADILDRLYAS